VTFDLETLKVIVEIAAAVISSIVAMLGVVWRWSRWLASEFEKRDAARVEELRQRDLALAAETVRAKVAEEEVRRSIEAHKLFAAEHFATEEGVAKAIEPIIKALDKMTDRLDRVLSDYSASRPVPPRARG